MGMFSDMAGLALDDYLELEGVDVTYTPAAGTGPVAALVAFGAGRQDEMALAEGQTRKLMQQILIRRTGDKSVAEPRYDDVIALGTSLNRIEWQVVDILEQNESATIVNCRRKHRNEVTRNGFRTS